jgi:hypothetical protein
LFGAEVVRVMGMLRIFKGLGFVQTIGISDRRGSSMPNGTVKSILFFHKGILSGVWQFDSKVQLSFFQSWPYHCGFQALLFAAVSPIYFVDYSVHHMLEGGRVLLLAVAASEEAARQSFGKHFIEWN